jgi:hypothetical protein
VALELEGYNCVVWRQLLAEKCDVGEWDAGETESTLCQRDMGSRSFDG